VGVGDASASGQMTYQTSYALARELGGQPAEFPAGTAALTATRTGSPPGGPGR
jgi:hypothetical protein